MHAPPGAALDLSTCDREPIHITGAIQPHGALVALDERDLSVAMASENLAELLGKPLGEVLGGGVAGVLDAGSAARLDEARRAASLARVNPLPLSVNGRAFDAVLHRSGGLLVVELEASEGDAEEAERTLHHSAQETFVRLQEARSLAELYRITVEEVQRLTGFERVMIYLFDPRDGHGEVVAEAVAAGSGCEHYLGLHYPASDIPQQARRLYALNWLRLIADVRYRPCPLAPQRNPLTGEPLDLSHSVLRSVSQIHVQYLINMGVSASMSISLVRDGRLFGLIALHHLAPRRVPYRLRLACELLGRVCSWHTDTLARAELAVQRARCAAVQTRLIEKLSASGDFHAALLHGETTLLDLVHAGGAAVCFEGHIETRGETPPREQIAEIARWLRERGPSDVFAAESLAAEMPWAAGFVAVGCGLLASALSREQGDFVLWFRPEWVRTLRWGGDPNKPATMDAALGQLTPRTSFAAWEQTVRLRAQPWEPWEVDAARDLRVAVVGIILRKAAEIAALNASLRAAVRGRDDFMSVASHELRTPITALGLHISSIRKAFERGTMNDANVRTRLEVAARQIDRLSRLVDELLDISNMTVGRLVLRREDVDLAAVARTAITRFEDTARESGTPITLLAAAEVRGRWDELRLDQVVTNLVSNALKYGAGQPIEVLVEEAGGGAVLRVKDRGSGVPEDAFERIFERFERASNAAAPQSLGLGLWIVRQIVEGHGGRVHLESRIGQGSTFTVTLPLEVPS